VVMFSCHELNDDKNNLLKIDFQRTGPGHKEFKVVGRCLSA